MIVNINVGARNWSIHSRLIYCKRVQLQGNMKMDKLVKSREQKGRWLILARPSSVKYES